MQHLDEGTIHAWLDGALGGADAATVEAHVALCPECADRVAEARGFIAASSRILSALDHVPAHVVPSREPAVAAAAPRPMVAAAAPPPNATASRAGDASGAKPSSRWGLRYARVAAVIAVVAAGTLLVARESERDAYRPAPVAPAAKRATADSLGVGTAPSSAAPQATSREAVPAPAAPPPAALGGQAGKAPSSRALAKSAPAPKKATISDTASRVRENASGADRAAADAAASAVRPSSISSEARRLDEVTVQPQAMQVAAPHPRLVATDTLPSTPRAIRETYLVGADTVVLEATPLDTLPNDQLRAAAAPGAPRDSSRARFNAIHWVGRDGTSYALSGPVSTQALEQIRVALGKR